MQIEKAAYAFQIDGNPVCCQEMSQGHINQTLKITTDTGAEYVLQKINKYVFRNPIRLMSNVSSVTDYLRQRVEDCRHALHFIPTHKGLYYHRDRKGEFWRMYDFVGGFCLNTPESDEDFYQSALAFGRFQQLLSDFPADSLYETIPEFHNTIDRYRQFKASVETDPCGRVAQCKEEIKFLMKREELGGILQKMRENGELPLRVTHNDTKLNNVMLREDSRTPLCVIDLDTTMPGLSAYDFGDSIRFGAAVAKEDEQELGRVYMSLDLFRIYTRGFLKACPGLTEKETEVLPLGALTMTLECGVRFLTDYLDGDHYFSCYRNGQNLDRCRTQYKMVADMERKWAEMAAIVKEEREKR